MIVGEWYRTHGYRSNPLFESPLKRKDLLLNYEYDRENLLYHVTAGSISLIEGARMSGKTMLLKFVIDEFRGRKKIIYIDLSKVSKRLDIEKLMRKRMGFWSSFVKREIKDIILMLDNVEDLTKKSFEKLHYYFDKAYLHSIVMTTKDASKLKMPKSLSDRIGSRIFKTQKLDRAEAVEMIKQKLGGKSLIKDYQIEVLYILADKSNHRFLTYLDAVLDHMDKNPDDSLSSKTINRIVKDIEFHDAPDDNRDLCDECGSRLVKVKGIYRCTECDSFCYGCGSLIDDDDEACPSCGREFEVAS